MGDQLRTGVLKSKLVPNSEVPEYKRLYDVLAAYPRGPEHSMVMYLEEKPEPGQDKP